MSKIDNNQINFAFFGSPVFSVDILEKLKAKGLLPDLIVTAPDKKKGRGQKLSPSPVGRWAANNNKKTLKPETIDEEFLQTLKSQAPTSGWDLFVVVAYGHILPKELIYLPEHNTLNIHPSLLPKLRGPAPIRGAILKEDETGVTIIELDEEMDHGPIVAQTKVAVSDWPPRYDELKPVLAEVGGELLAKTIPAWIAGDISATAQDEAKATYIEKFSSSDGEITFDDNPEVNLRKIRAFTNWPKTHFFTDDGTRVLITKAHLEDGELIIDRVKPSGSEGMDYQNFNKDQ